MRQLTNSRAECWCKSTSDMVLKLNSQTHLMSCSYHSLTSSRKGLVKTFLPKVKYIQGCIDAQGKVQKSKANIVGYSFTITKCSESWLNVSWPSLLLIVLPDFFFLFFLNISVSRASCQQVMSGSGDVWLFDSCWIFVILFCTRQGCICWHPRSNTCKFML